jgi:predicted kinase
MPKLIMMVGLPRSGKSTKALELGHPIVNPDSIRLAIHGQPFIGSAEPLVWAIAKYMVKALFLAGHQCVVLDATNTTRKRREEWKSRDWVRRYSVVLCDVDVCIDRAEEQYPNDHASRDGLIAAIRRMSDCFEAVGEDEVDPIEK